MDNGELPPDELVEYNRKFKKAILDTLFTVCDTFYIHCMPNPLLHVGKRGLLDNEKTDGIILVFGPYSTRNLSWDERFVFCEMQFGKWETIQIPYECIARMFDKSGQVIMQWATLVAPESHRDESVSDQKPSKSKESGTSKEKPDGSARVIEIDFTKKKNK